MSLKTENLSVGHGGCAVVEHVNLELKQGEILCLLGPNGSGKSTLIKTLLNLIPPCAGRVLINNAPLQNLASPALAKHLAYVPQSHANNLGFSVWDTVLMGRTTHWGLFGGPTPVDLQAVHNALDQLGISELKQRDFNLLSGGQQQLVLIARALCQGAQTLVLDEPTANLDFANASKVMNTLASLAAAGKSVVLSTHNPQDALGVNATACLLKGRAVLALGPANQVITSETLSALYGLPITVSKTESGHIAVVPGNH
ncbi:ABC transporter ATP-binding protein [Limnobacter sp.]|jgi:iron complex transport system ATP-binding protein|uniref:ABC transporter ATP-binding protein n=1 Tax=Limnobacter sp. TaxID=2003368 RepID=UPI002736CA1F|nr:ABC transporter ATP-binding protein [Limnobacter sp.]MDP3272143.1 ABC transporter ATP-binding protein [Limnobacter sp.]